MSAEQPSSPGWRRAAADAVLTVAGWLLPPPPPRDVEAALTAFRYQSVRRQVPALHIVAMVNVAIVMLVAWRQGTPIEAYGWMPLLWLYNLHRIRHWSRRAGGSDGIPPDAARLLRQSVAAGVVSIALISIFSAWSFQQRLFDDPVLIPVSLAFGAFAIAHCIAALRPAAVAVIAIGIFPSATVMLISGDFLAACIALSSLSVALLLLRFLAEHERHILATLALQHEVEQLASRDSLTGLLNRRAFLATYDRRVAGDSRRALLVIDIDHFKSINDRFGHDAGDKVLVELGERLAGACRRDDAVARFGGEEFVMLATVPPDRAAALAERLKRTLTGLPFDGIGRITVSIGVHPIEADDPAFDRCFACADAALYDAKRAGRDGVRSSYGSRSRAA